MKWMRTNLKIGYDLNQFSRLTPTILPQTIVSPLIQVYIVQHKQQSTIIKLADCLDIHPLQWNGDIIPYGTTNTIKRNLPFEARYLHICNVSQQMIVDLYVQWQKLLKRYVEKLKVMLFIALVFVPGYSGLSHNHTVWKGAQGRIFFQKQINAQGCHRSVHYCGIRPHRAAFFLDLNKCSLSFYQIVKRPV